MHLTIRPRRRRGPQIIRLGAFALVAAAISNGIPAQADDSTEYDVNESALPAPTDSVLPRTGIDPGLSDPYDRVTGFFGSGNSAAAAPRTGFEIIPQIGVAEAYTTNSSSGAAGFGGTGGNGGDDFVTLIQPAVTILDDSQRLHIDLNYAPTGEIYARNSGYSHFEQSAAGQIQVVAVPDWLYVDARGSIEEQSVYGGQGPTGTSVLSKNDRETNSSVSISPYISHSFGGTGNLQAGVGYIYSATDAPSSASTSTDPALGSLYGSSYLATKRAFASFTTGEDYGRFRDRLGTDDNFYDGAGALNHTHRISITDDASYAVTRFISLLGQIGYEDLTYRTGQQTNPVRQFTANGQPLYDGFIYGGALYRVFPAFTAAQESAQGIPSGATLFPAYSAAQGAATFGGYKGVIGAGGVSLTPSKTSQVTIEYRYLDGFGALYLQGSAQITPRLRAFGGYSEGITTFQEDEQNALLSGTLDATGVEGSAALAAPLLTTGNSFGNNQNLERLRRADLTLTYTLARDDFALLLAHEHTDPVGLTAGAQSGNTTTAGLTWLHAISEDLSLSSSAYYARNLGVLTGEGAAQTLSIGAGVDKAFSPSLTGYVHFGGTYVLSGNNNSGYAGGDVDTVVVGGVKRF